MSVIPGSSLLIEQESVQFNQPVSNAAASAIGALANYLRTRILPVGSVVYSMLDEATFQAECGDTTWFLANGQSCAGTLYESVSGNSVTPDLRGIFIRGKNYSRSTSTGNPDGDLAVGTYTADRFGTHNHTVTDPGHSHTITDPTHAHGTTDPGHIHGITQSTHNHGVSDPAHQHLIESFISPTTLAGEIVAGGNSGSSQVNGNDIVKAGFTGISIQGANAIVFIQNAVTGLSVNTASTGISVNSHTTGVTVDNSGSSESAPRNMTLNPFIRVN